MKLSSFIGQAYKIVLSVQPSSAAAEQVILFFQAVLSNGKRPHQKPLATIIQTELTLFFIFDVWTTFLE